MTDIRDAVEDLGDHAPFVLLPLRIEALISPGASGDELLVRVFPDDCWITAFDPALTPSEQANGWAYWAARWAAAGNGAELRTAWAALVQAHGAGRAAWIAHSYQPRQLGSLPSTRADDELVLVAATDRAVAGPVRSAAAAFWTGVWRAGGDPAAEAAAAGSGALAGLDAASAELVRTALRPLNLPIDPPPGLTRAQVDLRYQVLTFPAVDQRPQSFSQAPHMPVFPHQLRLIGMLDGKVVLDEPGRPIPLPLYAGPDPTGTDDRLRLGHDERGDLVVGKELAWLFDFDVAIDRGLGFRVALTAPAAAAGFDRLFVLGVHLADADDSAARLEELLRGHRYSSEDFELLAVGSPTNNTDGRPTPYQRTDDPGASFATVHRPGSLQVDATERAAKTDGQRLAEVLGLPGDLVDATVGGERFDLAEAEAMNTALWPATLGYYVEAMLATKGSVPDAVIPDVVAEELRRFFGRHVAGRGPAPAVRVGRQPYGVVATTAFSRLGWAARPPTGHTIPAVELMAPVLAVLRREWQRLADAGAARLPEPDATTAADVVAVLGLQATSAAFHQRQGEPGDVRYHLSAYSGDVALMNNVQAVLARSRQEMVRLLGTLGYRGTAAPELASKLFRRRAHRLAGPLVAANLSETDHGAKYLDQLMQLALSSLDDLRLERGIDERDRPLLHLLVKFALERSYQHHANRLLARAGVSPTQVAARRYEPPYVHVGERVSSSRWRDLFSPLPALTGDRRRPLHEVVTEDVRTGDAGELSEVIEALRRLALVPTARLDRLVAEHLDLAGYRLDAWLTGLVAYQLELMRFGGDPDATRHRPGLYLGAYGWLEDVRSRPTSFTSATIADPAVRATFEAQAADLLHDPANGGYLPAPSLDHATTAAVLRAGHLSHAHRDEPDLLAVNLSSERVRAAQVLLEGIRNGQGLGELLGYRLERALHDTGLPDAHIAIYALRAAFPLRAGRLAATAPAPGAAVPAEAIEARNVVDGQHFLEHTRQTSALWPFGLSNPPSVSEGVEEAVNALVDELEDLFDAVADLGLAEGVHQLLGGNPERSAAALDAFSQGGLPPEPDVVATPRRHVGITHQVVLHLDPHAPPGASPRSAAEPALNAWLGTVLPPAAQVGCRVLVVDPVDGTEVTRTITQAELGLEPIDLLMILDPESTGLMGSLDDRLAAAALAAAAVRPDAMVTVRHTDPVAGMVTFFELSAVIAELRPLLLGARGLRPDDLTRAVQPMGATVGHPRPAVAATVEPDRVDSAVGALRAARDAVAAVRDRLDVDRAAAQGAIDAELAATVGALTALDTFAVAAAGTGQLLDARRTAAAQAIAAAADLRAIMNERVQRFNQLEAEIEALPAGTPEAELIARWVEAERLVSVSATQDRSAADAVRAAAIAARAVFATRRDDLFEVVGANVTTLAGIRDRLQAAISASPSYPELLGRDLGVDLDRFDSAIRTLVDDMIRSCDAARAEADRRLAAADALTAAGPGNEAEALRAVLTDGTPIIGSFAVAAPVSAALTAARAAPAQADLLGFAQGDLGLADPVRDWRFGVARVRPAVWRWETAETLLDALRGVTGELAGFRPAALQLPHRAGQPWLAVQYPAGTAVEHDATCYTVVNDAPLATPDRLAGLVLDEWPELIPLPERTAGLAVHHDRPGSEPPQAWLTVTPATWDGRWHWDDLVMALNDTLDLARIRAVEPDLVDRSRLAPLLPAAVFPVYPVQISMTLNLALNNDRFRSIREG